MYFTIQGSVVSLRLRGYYIFLFLHFFLCLFYFRPFVHSNLKKQKTAIIRILHITQNTGYIKQTYKIILKAQNKTKFQKKSLTLI